jgi:uncharacterized protein (DUF1800 family)
MALTLEQSIALNRFGLGASAQDATADFDAKFWLRQQCRPYAIDPFAGAGLADTASMKLRRSKDNDRSRRQRYFNEMDARYQWNIAEGGTFRERLVRFWSNHFTISWTALPPLLGVVGSYEREAIRPHIMGRFEDLLLAVTRHPAMLAYLDNRTSVGPNSQAGRNRKRGLNENHAREILELHTLGVDGGYSQNDVIALAKMLTGWTLERGRAAFQFEPRIHEPGAKTLLGKRYGQKGEAQAEAALRDLARHPSTARFIATKLARHFEQDDPSPSLVERLADVFLQSQGDLAKLSEALIDAPELWKPELRKVKTPEELLISALRATGLPPRLPENALLQSAKIMGQAPFTAPSPQGWPDRAEGWAGPAALKARIDWANRLAAGIPSMEAPARLAKKLLGPLVSPRTISAIANAESPKQGLVLLLMSPEFQRR